MANNLPIQPSRLGDRLEEMDREILAWSKVTRERLLYKLGSLNLNQQLTIKQIEKRENKRRKSKLEAKANKKRFKEQELEKSLKTKLKKKDGEIERIAFLFVRHGIFLEHGVGRGRPVGSSKANQFKKPWLSVVLPPSIEDLADILSEQYADIAADELKINIPGIISTKTSK